MAQESTQYGLKNKLAFESLTKVEANLFIAKFRHKQEKTLVNLVIFALNSNTIRFHYSFSNHFNLEVPNSDLQLQNFKFNEKEFLEYKEGHLETRTLKIFVNENPVQIQIFDMEGNLLSSDEPELGFWSENLNYDKEAGQCQIRCYKQYQDLNYPPCIYGLGDKTGEINRWGKRFNNSPIDALGYDSEFTDPLYKDIPFFIHLDQKTKLAHGIFFDNFHKKFFDFGRERKPAPYYYFGAEAGDLNYYFINGPSIANVTSRYLELTGRPPLWDEFSYGYLASGMVYTENEPNDKDCDSKLLDLFSKFKSKKISASAFHLSSGYCQDAEGKRQQFIWNTNKFPSPKDFAKKAKDMGVELCANLKPVLLTNHPFYEEAKEKNLFLKDSKNKTLVVDYWGGAGSYMDFKNPDTQKWWKEKIKEHFFENGIYGIWNDNNEYEIFESHNQSGFEHQMANIMSKLSCQAYSEWVASTESTASEGESAWILSRSGYAGIQKYAQSWTGDNYSNWKSLQFDNAILSSCGLSGLIHMGVDIGGFWGGNFDQGPDPELLLRWIQNGVFTPRFCIHSYKAIPTEPDMYQKEHPKFFAIIQKFMQLREELKTYILDQVKLAHERGIPIMRPTVYDFQDDKNTYNQSFEYMFGDKYLIAPVYKSMSDSCARDIYLPGKDFQWKHYFSQEVFDAGQEISLSVNFSNIPVFEKI